MKKVSKWMNKPVTWGGYAKLAVICTAVSTIFTAVCWIVMFEPTWWITVKKVITKPFRKIKFRKND